MKVTVEVTLPSEREIQVKRTFNAPAARVFEFHSKPELVRKWLLGPDGSEMPVCEIDFRVGGDYRYVWRTPRGEEFGVRGRFLEIDAPHRCVHTESMDGAPGEALCTLTLEESEDRRTTLTMLMDFKTKDVRDMALESGMTEGMETSYDRLDEFVNEKSPAT